MKKNIRHSLSLACCSLLQPAASNAGSIIESINSTLEDSEIGTAVLLYSESDGRVSAIEPVIRLKKDIEDDTPLTVQVVFDALTGATPNGAFTSSTAQTFTTPSGQGSYTTSAGELPLDDTFRDTRVAVNTTLDKPVSRLRRNQYSINFSAEHDWTSLGGGYSYLKDSDDKNTTYTLSAALSYDAINPEGGAPTGFSTMKGVGDLSSKEGDQSRNTYELLAGVTKLLSKKTRTQLNLSVSQSSGYHNDPYKIVGEVNDVSGLPTGTYYYENRPDSRQRTVLYWKTAHHLTQDVIHTGVRLYQDDWGISSQTLDLKYRYKLGDGAYLQPHIRYYTQSAADFYRHSILASEAGSLPEFASADYRLAEMDTVTLGIKYGWQLNSGSKMAVRLEYIQQTGDSSPADAVGDQQSQDLYPGLNAIALQFNYSFTW